MPPRHPLSPSPPRPCFVLSPFRAFVILFSVFGLWLARAGVLEAGLDEQLDAVCRISRPGPAAGGQELGSGCTFQIAEGRVLVLTCAHVTEGQQQVSCEFWRKGHQSRALTGRVVARDAASDLSVVELSTEQFGGVLPRTVPLAPPGARVSPGEVLESAGCSGGSWATGFRGHALRYSGEDLYFVPAPANGRSGSAICNARGELVGVVRARAGDDSHGIATAVQAAYRLWGSQQAASAALAAINVRPAGRLVPVRAPHQNRLKTGASADGSSSDSGAGCPGGACPGGASPGFQDPYGIQPRWYLLPYRYREQFRNHPAPQPAPPPSGPGPAWPTLPAPRPGSDQPAPDEIETLDRSDLDPTNDRLDRIAGLQEQQLALLQQLMSGMATQQQYSQQGGTGPAPEVGRAMEQVRGQVEQIREDVHQETSRLRQAVEAVVANREQLWSQFQDRLAKVQAEQGPDSSRVDVARAYARDVAAEQLSTGAPGLTAGSLLASALGLSGPLAFALGGGLWLLSRRMGARLEK